jgi:hypothetical protein
VKTVNVTRVTTNSRKITQTSRRTMYAAMS